jgi:hypothetical protein
VSAAMHRLRYIAGVVVIGLGALLAVATAAQAQGSDHGATAAMKLTPVGGLPPVPVVVDETKVGSNSLVVRHGRWQFAPGDGLLSTLGVSVQSHRRKSVVRLEVARNANADCGTCGSWMVGLDVTRPLRSLERTADADGRNATLDISWNPVFGLAIPDRGDGLAFAAALNLPVTLRLPLGGRWRVSPFVAPGYGFGLIGAGETGHVGLRPLVGGGIALVNAGGRIQLSFGFRKVVLDGVSSTAGFGVVLAR